MEKLKKILQKFLASIVVCCKKFNEYLSTLFDLKEILYYIALDSKSSAKQFKNSLIEQIKSLSNMPFKFRKSMYKNLLSLLE